MSSVQEFYNSAYQTAFSAGWWGVFVGFAILLATFMIVSASSRESKVVFFIGVLVIVAGIICSAIWWIPSGSVNTATWATTDAWEAARQDRVRAYEYLFGYWESTNIITHTCRFSDYSKEDTNCVYVYTDSDEVCTGSGEDRTCRTDYEYYPFFTEEYEYFASLGVYEDGSVYFGRFAPVGNQYRWRDGIFGFTAPGNPPGDVLYTSHPAAQDFYQIKEAVDNNSLLAGAVPHEYENYFVATSNNMHTFNLPTNEEIQPYIDRDLLAGITPLNSNYSINFKVVHFSGTLGSDLDSPYKEMWYEYARMVAGNAGPTLEAYMFINFAYQSELPSTVPQWAEAQKAYLMNQDRFGRWVLPKNTMGLVCAVSDDGSTVLECAFFQGMFVGNGNVQAEVANASSFPFKPESFFGTLNGELVESENQLEAASTREGGFFDIIYDDVRGFKRQEMANEAFLYTNIEPTDDQKENILFRSGTRGFFRGFWPGLLLSLVLFAGVVASEYGGRR